MFHSGQGDCSGPVLPLPSLPLTTQLAGETEISGAPLFLLQLLVVPRPLVQIQTISKGGWSWDGRALHQNKTEPELLWSAAPPEHKGA